MHKLLSFWRLSEADRATILQAVALFLVVRAMRRFVRYQCLQSLLGRLPTSQVRRSRDALPEYGAQHIARLVSVAERNYGAYLTCLDRSTVLWALLRRHGIESDVWVGVSKAGGKFAAHAWVEHQGHVLNDSADVRERFVPLSRISTWEPTRRA